MNDLKTIYSPLDLAEEHLNQVQELGRADDDKLMDGTRVTS